MMSMPMLDRANDLLERADKLDDAGLLGQGAQNTSSALATG